MRRRIRGIIHVVGFGWLPWVAWLAIGGSGCASPTLPEVVRVVGLGNFQPVPADNLAVRLAEQNAIQALKLAVQGFRYTRVADRFSLIPGAWPDVRPEGTLVVGRDAVLDEARPTFVVTVEAEIAATFTEAQRDKLATGHQYAITISLDLRPSGSSSDSLPIAWRPTYERALDLALRQHARAQGDELETTGRAFVVTCVPHPQHKFYRSEKLWLDPVPEAQQSPAFRYRQGLALSLAESGRLLLNILIVLVPDERIS